MPVSEVAAEHYAQRQTVADDIAAEGERLWREVDPAEISESWQDSISRLTVALTAAQRAVASRADSYTDAALRELNVDAEPEGEVDPRSLSGQASDGRPLTTLLAAPVVTAKVGLAGGATVDRALASGLANLEMVLRTQIADAGRVADGVAVASRRGVGYVRHLTPPSCGRCVVLAGRWYRYNAGFPRHPSCDCTQVPAPQSTSGDLTSNPQGYFDSLSEAEQNKAFTRAGAQAIRDGADISQVVNARRGALGLSQAGRLTRAEQRMLRGGRDRGQLQRQDVFGRQLATTTEGTTVRGVAGRRLARRGGTVREQGERMRRARAPRLMPESIYEIAEDRAHVIELLRLNGYIL